MSDATTSVADVIVAMATVFATTSGLTAERVVYGAYDAQPVTGKALTWRLLSTGVNPSRGSLTREEYIVTFEVRLWAPSTDSKPYTRDATLAGFYADLRAACYADKTRGAIVRDITVSDLTLPSSAGDLGTPSACGLCVVAVRWHWGV